MIDLEKKRAKGKQWYEQNREYVLEYRANWRTINRQRQSDQRRDMKIALVRLKGSCCERCGYSDHPAALQFHHRDPEVKVFAITTATSLSSRKYPLQELLAEIAKCDLLCANCHAVLECEWQVPDDWTGLGEDLS